MVTLSQFEELAINNVWVKVATIGKKEIFLRRDKRELMVDTGCNIHLAFYDNTGKIECLRWDWPLSESLTKRLLGLCRRLKMVSIYANI